MASGTVAAPPARPLNGRDGSAVILNYHDVLVNGPGKGKMSSSREEEKFIIIVVIIINSLLLLLQLIPKAPW